MRREGIPPPAVKLCAICDERPAIRVLALDQPLAVCHSCATGLRRDGIDLMDEEEGTEPKTPVPDIGPSRFCNTPVSPTERAALLRARKTLKRPQNVPGELAV